MSKNGGSEKTTQAFVAAYYKPRLSTCSTHAEATVGVLHSGRTNTSIPTLPNSPHDLPHPQFSGLFRAREWCGMGITGGQSQLDVTGPMSVLSQDCTALFHHFCPDKSSSLRPLTPSPAQEQHAVLWCAPAPLPLLLFQLSLQPTTGTE